MNKHAREGFQEGQWTGRRAFIIGGGPSLIGFPFKRLKDELVIAVNRAHECKVSDVVFTGDCRWLNQFSQASLLPNAPLVYARRKLYQGKTARPMIRHRHPFYIMGTDEENLWGHSIKEGVSPGDSGIRAVNFAEILGADPIYLLGFDMDPTGARGWWHKGYSKREDWFKDFLAHWEKVVESGRIRSQIINLNPDSKLRCLPFGDFEEVMRCPSPV